MILYLDATEKEFLQQALEDAIECNRRTLFTANSAKDINRVKHTETIYKRIMQKIEKNEEVDSALYYLEGVEL